MEKAVIFGCGETARKYRDKICERFDVIAYTCNDSSKWGQTFDGLTVLPPSPGELREDVAIVVAASDYYPEIIYGLEKQGRKGDLYAIIDGEIVKYVSEAAQKRRLPFPYPRPKLCPTILQLGYSSLCNSKCQYCVYHSSYANYNFHKGLMDDETLDAVVRQIKPVSTFKLLQLIGDGETFINPKWQDYTIRVLEAQPSFEAVTLFTNGMLLTEENVKKLADVPIDNLKLAVSIDGLSPEDCEYWRAGEKFSIIRDNLHRAYEILCRRKAETVIAVTSCIVLPKRVNVSSAFEVESFLQESVQWLRNEFPFAECIPNLVMPWVDGIPGVRNVKARRLPRQCGCVNPFHLVTIFADGGIISCPCGEIFRDSGADCVGNVKKDDMLEVFYHNETFQEIRRDLLDGKTPRVCGICPQLSLPEILCLQRED